MTNFRVSAVLLALLAAGCAKQPQVVLRIDCGAAADWRDPAGNVWAADSGDSVHDAWRVSGGGAWTREKDLSIPGELAELYRSERFGAKAYEFRVADGTYSLRLHTAETFERNYLPGMRVFDIVVNGRTAVSDFDPVAQGGGFCRPVAMEVAGIRPDSGAITLTFVGKSDNPVIQGIELVSTAPAAWAVTRLTTPAAAALPADYETNRPVAPGAKSVMWVGNSHTFFWAVPYSVEQLVNEYSDLRIHSTTAYRGGRGVSWLAEDTAALRRVRGEHHDILVLQGAYGDEDRAMAASVAKAARAVGTRVLLYCDWDWGDTTEEQALKSISELEQFGRSIGAEPVPVRRTGLLAQKALPGLVLRNKDGIHAGVLGGWASAATFFAVLTGSSPEVIDTPAVLAGQIAVPPAGAKVIAKAAWEAAQAMGK